MTKEELGSVFELNSSMQRVCHMIVSCDRFPANIQERARIAKQRLKEKEAELEDVGRGMMVQEYIDRLEDIERELG